MTHASVDTWDVIVGFPQGCFIERKGLITPLEGPLIHRRQTMSSTGPNTKNALRSWRLALKSQTPSEYAQLIALFDSSACGCEPIDMTFRGFSLVGAASETIQVRFVADSLSIKATSPVRFDVRVEVEEFMHAP